MVRKDVMTEAELRLMPGIDHDPKKAGDFQKLEKSRKQPLEAGKEPPQGMQLC